MRQWHRLQSVILIGAAHRLEERGPRSGCDFQPRFAAAANLGIEFQIRFNPDGVASSLSAEAPSAYAVLASAVESHQVSPSSKTLQAA
jgi:hypothetical protein